MFFNFATMSWKFRDKYLKLSNFYALYFLNYVALDVFSGVFFEPEY